LLALAGTELGLPVNAALGKAFGGPLRCSHFFTLVQLLNSAVSTSLDWNDRLPQDAGPS
jgi:hypothetical protein